MIGLQKKSILIIITAFILLQFFGCAARETRASDPARASESAAQNTPRNASAAAGLPAPEASASPLSNVSLGGDGYYTCDYNGEKRKFILYVPESAGEGAPLVLMMHGYAGTSKSFMQDTGMNAAADKYGYAVAYPQGIPDKESKGGACWNSGLKSSGNDDIGFLVSLAKYLQRTYGFSEKHTFAAGLSNGAFMSYKLACGASKTFRAVASVAGTMSRGAWEQRRGAASVGILQINGTKDEAVPVGSPASGGVPDIRGVIEYWKNANGLDEYREFKLSAKSTVYEYSGKNSGTLVWYIEIEGGRHGWPAENFAGFNASETILDFFSRFVNEGRAD